MLRVARSVLRVTRSGLELDAADKAKLYLTRNSQPVTRNIG